MFRESKKKCMIDLHTHSSLFQAVHSPAQRLITSVMACFAPVFTPETFKYKISTPAALQVICSKWGDLGQLIYEDFSSRNSQLYFEPPQSISSDDLPRYEKLIREECLGPRGRLAELFGQKDIVDQNSLPGTLRKTNATPAGVQDLAIQSAPDLRLSRFVFGSGFKCL